MTPLPTARLGRSGVLVSRLALGTLTFGREADEDTSRVLLDRYLDSGGNLLDTADVYGESELILGRLLAGRRDDVVIAGKVGLPGHAGGGANDHGASRLHIRRQIDRSLTRLGTDRIDLYQIHCWDPLTPLEETLSTLDDLVRTGKVRYLGLSNVTGWQVAKAMGVTRRGGWEPIVSLSPQYSLVERGFERDLAGVCHDESLAVLPYSPLGGGFLSGKYPAGRAAAGGLAGGAHERQHRLATAQDRDRA